MLTPDHSVTGWNTTLTGLVLLSGAYVLPLAYRAWAEHRSFRRIVGDSYARMLVGFALLCLGIAFRIGGWIPWRGMRLGNHSEWVEWWADHSGIWTGTGVVLAVIGTTLIMWPALQRMAGSWAIALAAGSVAVLFLTGVILTEIVAHIL